MATERVDKQWQDKGLEQFSTDAIIGTLAHYGVSTDEPAFTKLAGEHYPLGIAQAWHQTWKGTGPFARFPAAAAEELWHRVTPGGVAPTDVGLAIVNLIKTIDLKLGNRADDGTLATRFKVVENYLGALPTDEDRRELFLAELVGALGPWMELFDGLAEKLAEKGAQDEADRFLALEERLFPVRLGSARALVRAARGDVSGALEDLLAIANDASRDDFARLCAVDGLMQHDQLDDARAILMAFIDKAEADKDIELGAEVVQRLTLLLKANPKMPERLKLRQRIEQLAFKLKPPEEPEA
jgi:hypothetical protein